ncbi:MULTISPECIES: 5-formyltetrahydrofolate cyclo-ligase [Streptomyces]|uniref:5-formyltetrahydrofolate cyclo-ligase n=1 Tax=Streptomyces nanshensis TaxID=518642 RepID=A0A1E7L837_9ACTN|nr:MULTISPECIES: 5-formyltetrahydrofolate cyclo-ligase [Streptomyces]OEV12339.1 5-formyltetrahydrofolate cyclo-ligase [Streptomyces nanshensis]
MGGAVDGTDGSKHTLRESILAVRARLTARDAQETATVLAERALELPELAEAHTVAAYVSIGGEPGTGPLLEALRAQGVRVLLPVLLPDNDLDWAVYEGAEHLVRARRGLLEPTGPRLGPDAVTRADAVLLPGLAVDGQGIRLGRGGGSYDRALARIVAAGARPVLAVLLYDAELVGSVPAEPHDLPVSAAVTPSAIHRFTAPPPHHT